MIALAFTLLTLLILCASGACGVCTSFANLGQACNEAMGNCCGGGPKNAKCENAVCMSTFPTPGPAPTPSPAPVACTSFANLGQACNDAEGKCCGGGPKNAKCENAVCVTTFSSGE